ncbi:MAG TPA: hypothetical protein VKA96_07895 [Solirubrobacteraceae bacterium]|nr:hypothetical protein [Solirubrobacteraceae bacterium]
MPTYRRGVIGIRTESAKRRAQLPGCDASGGSPYTRFRRALETGDVALVKAAAAELPHVGLVDALKIVWLYREDDQLYERAAVRWVGRFALEATSATLEDVQSALSGLAGVAMGFPGALEELANLCRDCGITRI